LKRLLTAFLCIALTACAGRTAKPAAPVAGAPAVAVLSLSTARVKEFGYRKPVRFDLKEKRIDPTDVRRVAIIDAFGAQTRDRLATAGYPVVDPEAVARAEASLQAAQRLDVASLRQTLGADWLLLSSLSRWDEEDPGGGRNAVVVSLVMTLYDLRTRAVVWEAQVQDREFRLLNNLQHEPADFVRVILRRVMKDLPPATGR
jgi:hypothetical protein